MHIKARSTLSMRNYKYMSLVNRYAGKITRIMAENVLEDLRDGAFLVRNSTDPNSEYTYTIAIKYVMCVQ